MDVLLCPYQTCVCRFRSLSQLVFPSSTVQSKESPTPLNKAIMTYFSSPLHQLLQTQAIIF